jgi:NADPH-dependent curcumin reductase CurA
MQPLPSTSRAVRLRTSPEGLPRATNFEVFESALPGVSNAEALVRNLYFLVSASLRMMINPSMKQVDGVPFPAVREGDTLQAEALGEIISAPADSGLSPGDWVLHFQGWRDYASVPVSQCRLVEAGLPSPAAYLGHGWTAYSAFTRGVQIKRGDTVFISSAAGAIGSMAGQIARLLGAGRVIGSTSSRDKAAKLVSDLGYDATVIRGATPIAQQLAETAPEGLDVFLDTVGGEQLHAGIAAARQGARILIVGNLAGQLAVDGVCTAAPLELDSLSLLLKKITIRGYSADDDSHLHAEWIRQFAVWLRVGAIRFPHEIIKGLDSAPLALERAIKGDYFGTVLVQL